MTRENADGTKRRSRELQKRTGWSYQECLNSVRTMTPEGIEALIKMRNARPVTES